MNRLGIVLLLFIAINIFGQDTDKDIDIKLYTNYNYTPKYIYYSNDTVNGIENIEYNKVGVFNLSPALVFNNKKGNSSEIEISRFRYKTVFDKKYNIYDSTGVVINTISGKNTKEFEVFIRYEYDIALFKKKEWKVLKPIIGFSAISFYKSQKSASLLSTDFPVSTSSMGVFLSVIPKLEYNINRKLYMDFNIPINIATVHYSIYKDENPSLIAANRTKKIIDFYNTPLSFAIRLGVGLKI